MTQLSKIRKRILKQRGVELEKHTRNPVLIADTPAVYHKTYAMKMVESKLGIRIDEVIFTGSIYQVGKQLGLDPTTISKWRKVIREAKEKAFWKEFKTDAG